MRGDRSSRRFRCNALLFTGLCSGINAVGCVVPITRHGKSERGFESHRVTIFYLWIFIFSFFFHGQTTLHTCTLSVTPTPHALAIIEPQNLDNIVAIRNVWKNNLKFKNIFPHYLCREEVPSIFAFSSLELHFVGFHQLGTHHYEMLSEVLLTKIDVTAYWRTNTWTNVTHIQPNKQTNQKPIFLKKHCDVEWDVSISWQYVHIESPILNHQTHGYNMSMKFFSQPSNFKRLPTEHFSLSYYFKWLSIQKN